MDVRGFPSHGVQKAEFGVGSAQRGQFDAGTMWTEATNDPTSAQLNKGIGTADGAIDDGLIQNFSGAFVSSAVKALGPDARGRDERFRFASDASTVPVRDSDIARMTKTAESGNAMRDAK